MDVELTLSAHGKGRILLGASHEVASFHAQLDAANKSDAAVPSFQSGFKNTTFAASGQLGVEARFGLPLTIGVGIEITPLKFRKLLSLINEPFVDATATYQHDAQNATACNDGVAYELTLGDEVSMNFFDLSSMSLYKAQTPPLVKGCALLDG
ncbi:hypothetical protein B0J12DRAFT_648624 [Macrophomina phaseolina]|nr:hypothetical protein B0J12DRAFT_648624 [Macrophomina phaseolina]